MTIKTGSSIPTKLSEPAWHTLRKEVRKDIMNTDILCEVQWSGKEDKGADQILGTAFAMMRTFANRYSRFKKVNELYRFNQSEHTIVSPELFALLSQAKQFHASTNALFDPSILAALEDEGYHGAGHSPLPTQVPQFSELTLDPKTRAVSKPKGLYIDLGGIGKGYIVDQVATYLSRHFDNFLIDAGGDIFVRGVNKKEEYPYWAIDVEHPTSGDDSAALLLLTNMAVATSGRNRRRWQKQGQEKHHIIDPRTQKSASQDFQSVTVIAKNTTTADVLAKTLFIAGGQAGPQLAEQWNVPAIFITESGRVTINHHAQPYVWKAS